jgi:HEAT repeat protein
VRLAISPVASAGEAPAKKPEAKIPELSKASWIWDAPNATGEGTFGCYFRKTFELPAKPKAAVVIITADNGYDLAVNGSLVGGDAGFDAVYWKSIEKYDITDLLAAGKNVIAVKGENMGGPAGLLAAARIEMPDGSAIEYHSDASWRFWLLPETEWMKADYDDKDWKPSAVLCACGAGIWGKMTYPSPEVSPGHDRSQAKGTFSEGGPDFAWPDGVVFLRGRVPESTSPGSPQSLWQVRGSRAYLEHDAPAPAVLGRQLYALVPGKRDGKLALLHDAAQGVIGSPSVSYDGRTIYFCMAPAGEHFLHVYSMQADGSGLKALTQGPFQDYDPAPLPDGRIVFSSTRIGSREEYHGNLASSLFTMSPDGSHIRPLTHHIVADREPKVMANGCIVFVRSDNFLERAKVETQIHQTRMDGTGGIVLLGGDRGAIGYGRAVAAESNSAWLRHYGFGSPAPLPDGRVVAISSYGLVVSGTGSGDPERVQTAAQAFDISPMPDGRLLCTVAGRGMLAVLDPRSGNVVPIHAAPTFDLSSVVYLGPRPKPPLLASDSGEQSEIGNRKSAIPTGFLICQSVHYTKQTNADVKRIKAVRVYEGRALALRSARHPYDHIGVEAVELGTAPLAPDGSFHVRVPADRPLAMQAVDAEGRAVINEMTWIYARPGERRTCVGCHSPRPSAPSMTEPLAARLKPVDLLGQGDAHRFRANNAANGGVLNLQLDRFREAANISLYPQRPLAPGEADAPLPPGRPSDVKRLCGLLAGTDENLKISAARSLGIFRDRAAVPSLLKILSDSSVEVRVAAAMSLAASGSRDAAEGLLAALGDENPFVAQAAHVALENLTGHSLAFNAFVPEQRDGGASAWREWLRKNGWPAIEAELAKRLADKDPLVVRSAIEALGHTGGDAAKAALRDFLARNPDAELRTLMAALRALGHLRDKEAVPLLADIIAANARKDPGRSPDLEELGWLQKPLYLTATAAEALGWIATPEAEKAILNAFPNLLPFWDYTLRAGDHSWLMGCHSSPVHYRMIEALDAIGSRDIRAIVPHVLRSVPLDTDRGLLLDADGYENLVARVVQRAGLLPDVMETALSILGDTGAKPVEELKAGVTASPPASSCGHLSPPPRAAQIAAVVCLDARYGPRLRAALDRFRATPQGRDRSWTCFFLARALGRCGDKGAVETLTACLEKDPTEASLGLETPPNTFIHKGMTPFHRAAAAYALGLIGDRAAAPVLLKTVADLDNAVDTRNAAAQALALLRDPVTLPDLKKLADDYPEVATRRWLLLAVEKATGAAPDRTQSVSRP